MMVSVRRWAFPSRGSSPPVSTSSTSIASRYIGTWDAKAMPPGRDARMQIGESLLIGEPKGFRHESFDQLQHAVRPINEALEDFPTCDASIPAAALIEPSLSPRGFLCRRQEDERQVISGLEMGALLFELRFALGIEQRRDRVGERAFGIVLGHIPATFDEDCPT